MYQIAFVEIDFTNQARVEMPLHNENNTIRVEKQSSIL